MSHHEENEAGAGNAPAMVRAAEFLISIGGMLSTLLILLVFAIVAYAITQRYVLDTPLLWGDEFIGYTLVAIVMLGAAEALRRGDHISIDLLASRAGGALRTFLGALSNIAVIVFAVIIGWSAWESITFARAFGSYSVGYIEIETWIPQVPMLFGAALLILASLTRIIRLFASTGER